MVQTSHPARPVTLTPPPLTASRRQWRWQEWLALVGVGFLVWQAWTLIAWLAAGPRATTQDRDRSSAAWAAAHIYEAVAVVVAVVVVGWVVRQCRREGRLVFDAQLCIAGALCYWLDPVANMFQPVYVVSSNFINIGNWCSQMPFIPNNDCGRNPEPIVFMGLLYVSGFVVCGHAIGALLRAVRRRWPAMSWGRLLLVLVGVALCFDIVVEMPPILLHLWNYPSSSDRASILGHATKYPLSLAAGAVFGWGAVGLVHFIRDDRGRTIFEQRLDHLAPRRRTLVSTLALVAYMNLMVFGVDLILATGAPYASPWRGLPAHVVNGACDTADGTVTGTRYGPCPGSPGYKAPLRHLPGRKPPQG